MHEPIIHVVTDKATDEQLEEMSSYSGSRIKVAVDIVKGTLAGGGEWHVDCKEVLMAHGSSIEDIWGGAYYIDTKEMDFLSHINIRPQDGNVDRYIGSEDIRTSFERIVRERLAS